MMSIPHPSTENGYLAEHALLLADSFFHLLKRPLLGGVSREELGKGLFEADRVIVSHDTAMPPVFNYGNRMALSLFEMTWNAFTSLPSKYSAEPGERAERERLLNAVNTKGFIDDYSGVRISSTGARFRIERAIVWNVVDGNGILRGQAACFDQWYYIGLS